MSGNYKLDYTGDQTNEAIGIALNCQKQGFYKEDPDNSELYENRVRECLASWLLQDYASTSIDSSSSEHWGTDEDETSHETVRSVFRYGYHGYIKAAIGSFFYKIGQRTIEEEAKDEEVALRPTIAQIDADISAKEEEIAQAQTETERAELQAELEALIARKETLENSTVMRYYQQTHENIHVAVGYDKETGQYDYDARAIEMDCCVFASMITKCYTYEDSIYKNVIRGNYDLQKALKEATYAYRSDRRKYIGHDANNNVTTDEWAEALYYSGTKFNLFAHTGEGTDTTDIYPNALANIRTGDLVFFGIGNAKREAQFLGIHHVGIYVKDLDELKEYAPSGVEFHVSNANNGSTDERYSDPQYGYIVHVCDYGNPKRYVNVLRIDTMTWAAKYYNVNVDSDTEDRPRWHDIYVCHVVPNTINVSGGMEASTSWRNAWGKAFFTNWHDTNHFFSIRSFNGGIHTTSIGISGYYLQNGVDFNTMLENGRYRFSSNPADNRLTNNLNMPVYSMGFLDVENNPITDRFREHGAEKNNIYMTVQTYTAFPYYDNAPNTNQLVIYKRWIGHTGATATRWSPWYKVFDSADIAGDSAHSKPSIVQSETEVRPMVTKYF